MQPGRFLVAVLAFWSAVAPVWTAEPLCCLVCLCDEGVVNACAARPVEAVHKSECACCASSKHAVTEPLANSSAVCSAVPGSCGKCDVSPQPSAVVSARVAFGAEYGNGGDWLPATAWPSLVEMSIDAAVGRVPMEMAHRPPTRASLCVWVI